MSQAVQAAYARGEEDETLLPLVLADKRQNPVGRISPGDSVIFYNIRGEREIELTRSLTEKHFDEFPIARNLNVNFATMIEYHKGLNTEVAFPPAGVLGDTLSDVIAAHGLRQAKITEAEKAIHVSYFFNGKKETLLPGEERIVVPTRKDVRLFDEAPEMSIDKITAAALDKINDDSCNFIVVNFPNVDVLGHIENREAIIRGVEAVDRQTGILVEAARRQNVAVIVTADHGTVEKWLYPDGSVDTGHTTSPVPFILLHPDKTLTLRPAGELTDVAPTILQLLGLAAPATMTGHSLVASHNGTVSPVSRLLLIILDGWGLNENTQGNLIACSATPVMDSIADVFPSARLAASGSAVGLPAGTVGNSEAGHLHIGAGRRIYSDRVNIDHAIAGGTFCKNEAFLRVMRLTKENKTALHLMGIVSFFSSHGSIGHLFTLMEMAHRQGIERLFIHAMLGRRGEQAESGVNYIRQVEEKCRDIGLGQVVSVIGRYWSMDREENWDRIEKTYRMLVYGDGNKIPAEHKP